MAKRVTEICELPATRDIDLEVELVVLAWLCGEDPA